MKEKTKCLKCPYFISFNRQLVDNPLENEKYKPFSENDDWKRL